MLTNLKIEEIQDRRRRPRLRLFCSLRLHRQGAAPVVARTEDISCQGFYFTSEDPLELNERLECELIIRSEEMGYHSAIDVVLRGRAEVVRVVPQGQRFGVACRLEDYTADREVAAKSAPARFFVETPIARELQTINATKRPFLVSEES